MSKVILIVGASKGIGLTMARTLQGQGHTIYGTSRNPAKADIHDIRLLQLDVSDDETIRHTIDTIMDEVGRIDVVINNAGYDLHGAAEDTTFDELFQQMDTNFFGGVRVIQAVLPIMRQQNSGQIINVSSIGGLLSLPFNSAYAASKFAIEGYSESLRYELLPFNIFVSLVEPGQIRTDTLDSSNVTTQTSTTYDAQQIRDRLLDMGREASLTPAQVGDTIAKIINTQRPKLRYPVGMQIRLVMAMRRLLPAGLFERFIMGQFVRPILT